MEDCDIRRELTKRFVLVKIPQKKWLILYFNKGRYCIGTKKDHDIGLFGRNDHKSH